MRKPYEKPKPVDGKQKAEDLKQKKSGLICAYRTNFKLLRNR
ncbi:MAG: hypothetical protein P1P63_00030 [Treponemataceae bacterium]